MGEVGDLVHLIFQQNSPFAFLNGPRAQLQLISHAWQMGLLAAQCQSGLMLRRCRHLCRTHGRVRRSRPYAIATRELAGGAIVALHQGALHLNMWSIPACSNTRKLRRIKQKYEIPGYADDLWYVSFGTATIRSLGEQFCLRAILLYTLPAGERTIHTHF